MDGLKLFFQRAIQLVIAAVFVVMMILGCFVRMTLRLADWLVRKVID